MKILFVHDRFGAFGGAEANILATASELKARGHIVGILHGPRTEKGEPAWMHAFPTRFPISQLPGSAVFQTASRSDSSRQDAGAPRVGAANAIGAFNPDLIYVHKLAELEILAELVDSGVPIVRMVHDHDLCCMRSYKYNYFTRRICEREVSSYCVFPCGGILARDHEGFLPIKLNSYSGKLRELELNRRFDRMIVATDYMKEELLRNKFDSEKIEIHPPVPAKSDSTFFSSFSDRNIIIYAGQIIRGKGVDVLLESLARVKVPFECYIFGDGNHRAACEKLSRKLGLANRVHFKGYVPPEEFNIYYRECSVIAVSSVWPEPFGGVGLEAMHFGLPVVAFDAGGIKEWLIDGHNGRLVSWMDRDAFASNIEDLLRDKALARRLGENGRHMVTQRFDFGNYISGLENLFARLAGKTREAALV